MHTVPYRQTRENASGRVDCVSYCTVVRTVNVSIRSDQAFALLRLYSQPTYREAGLHCFAPYMVSSTTAKGLQVKAPKYLLLTRKVSLLQVDLPSLIIQTTSAKPCLPLRGLALKFTSLFRILHRPP